MELTIVKIRYSITHGLFKNDMSEAVNNNLVSPTYVTSGQNVEISKLSHKKEMVMAQHSHEEQMQQMKDKKDIIIYELGWVGRFFGGEKNSSKNITAALT